MRLRSCGQLPCRRPCRSPHEGAPAFMAGAAATALWMLVLALHATGGTYGKVIRSQDSATLDMIGAPLKQGQPTLAVERRMARRTADGRRPPGWLPAADNRRERSTGLFRINEAKRLISHGYTLVINSRTFQVEATNVSNPEDGLFITRGHLPEDTPGWPTNATVYMTIQGKKTKRFVCMNATGHLYSDHTNHSLDCAFKENHVSHFSTFCSANHTTEDGSRTDSSRPEESVRTDSSRLEDSGRTDSSRPEDSGRTDSVRPEDSVRTDSSRPDDGGRTDSSRPMCLGISHSGDILNGNTVNMLTRHAHFTKHTAEEPHETFPNSLIDEHQETFTDPPISERRQFDNLHLLRVIKYPTTSPPPQTTTRTTTRDPFCFILGDCNYN